MGSFCIKKNLIKGCQQKQFKSARLNGLKFACLVFLALVYGLLNNPAQATKLSRSIAFFEVKDGDEAPLPNVSLLMYHHVSETAPRSTSVTPAELRAHLDYLQQNGYQIISMQTALAGIADKTSLPDRAVVLTFDDAYQDIFTQGRPILNEYDVPWALFVATDPIGDTAGEYMSWEQLKILQEEGVFIGNHSQDHAHLPRRLPNETKKQWQARVLQNIQTAQKELEARLGIQHKVFAYPYGEYNNALKELLAQEGYLAFGQHSGGFGPSTDKQAIPRFASAGIYANLETLSTKMAALAFDIAAVDYTDTLLKDPSPPKLTLTFNQLDFHPHLFQCFAGGEPSKAKWLSKHRVEFQGNKDLPIGRSRYNCTAPSISKPGRYYWFSIQWILADAEGNWPD